MNETKSWSFDQINKSNQLLYGKQKDNMQIISIRSESGDIPTGSIDTKKKIMKYYKQLHGNNFDDIDEKKNFLNSLNSKTQSRRNRHPNNLAE